jgi:hypothetical protein
MRSSSSKENGSLTIRTHPGYQKDSDGHGEDSKEHLSRRKIVTLACDKRDFSMGF